MNVQSRITRVRFRSDVRPAILLAVVLLGLVLFESSVLTNYGSTLARVTEIGLVALGLTPLLILGEVDLSVGAMMGLAGVIAAKASDPALGIALALGAAIFVGLLHTFLIVVVRVSSFIATLGTMIVLQGLALLLSNQTPVPYGDLHLVVSINNPVIGQIQTPALVLIGVAVVMQVVLGHTTAGRGLYAIGGNRDAAVAAGIRMNVRVAAAFVVCSMLAAVAGILSTMTSGTGDPNVGTAVLLSGITAAVIGGCSIAGGQGTASGTLMASIAVAGLTAGLELSGVDTSVESVVIGVILFVAVTSEHASVHRIAAIVRSPVLGRQRE